MSEIRGPLHALSLALVEPIEQHRRLPPHLKILAQISLSAHSLGWCLYLCPLFKTGPYLAAVLMGAALFGNGRAPDEWLPLAAWAGLTVISVLWLLAAMKSAQGMRDYWMAFSRLVLAGACAALLWYRVYPDWGPLVELLLKGFYIAWGLSHFVRFIVAAQLFAGMSAFNMVTGNIAASAFNWNAAPRRRRFFFW